MRAQFAICIAGPAVKISPHKTNLSASPIQVTSEYSQPEILSFDISGSSYELLANEVEKEQQGFNSARRSLWLLVSARLLRWPGRLLIYKLKSAAEAGRGLHARVLSGNSCCGQVHAIADYLPGSALEG